MQISATQPPLFKTDLTDDQLRTCTVVPNCGAGATFALIRSVQCEGTGNVPLFGPYAWLASESRLSRPNTTPLARLRNDQDLSLLQKAHHPHGWAASSRLPLDFI